MGLKEDITRKGNYLTTTKDQIRLAVAKKGIEIPTSAKFSTYGDYIRSILWRVKNEVRKVYITMSNKDGDHLTSDVGIKTVTIYGDRELETVHRFNFFAGINLAGHYGRAYRYPLTNEVPDVFRQYIDTSKNVYGHLISGNWKHLMILYRTPFIYINFLRPDFHIESPTSLNMNEESPLIMTGFYQITFRFGYFNGGFKPFVNGDYTTISDNNEVGSIVYCDIPLWCEGRMIWPNYPWQEFPYREGSSML